MGSPHLATPAYLWGGDSKAKTSFHFESITYTYLDELLPSYEKPTKIIIIQFVIRIHMPDYIAPKPKYPYRDWAKWLLLRIIFPPIILWDLLKIAFNYLFGKMLSNVILSAQLIWYSENKLKSSVSISQRLKIILPRIIFPPLLIWDLLIFGITFLNRVTTFFKDWAVSHDGEVESEDKEVNNLVIETHDGVKLETIEFKLPKQENVSNPYIIIFGGNSGCFQKNNELPDINRLNCNVVAFNYRGVAGSSGSPCCAQDLVTDGIAQVERLLAQGVKPEDILLNGRSIGSAVATLVCKYFHDREIKVKLFLRDPPSSLTNVVISWLRAEKNSGYKEKTSGKIVGWLLMPLIKFFLVASQWEMEVADAYKKIPDEYKEYTLVRSSKIRRNEVNPGDDTIIPYYASLHAALKPIRQQQKLTLTEGKKEALKQKKLYAPFELRESVSGGYYTIDVEGHAEFFSKLRTRDDKKTGNEYFEDLVNRKYFKKEIK